MPTQTRTLKPITVLVGGSGKTHDVNIPPGLTVRDLLEQLNLSGHLTKFGEATPLGENEDVYSRVNAGDKLILGPNTPVSARRVR